MGKLAIVGVPVEVNSLITKFLEDNGIPDVSIEVIPEGRYKGFINNKLILSEYIVCFILPSYLSKFRDECADKYTTINSKLVAYEGNSSIIDYLTKAFKVVNKPQVVDFENLVDIAELTALEEQYEKSQSSLNEQVDELRGKIAEMETDNQTLTDKVNELESQNTVLLEKQKSLTNIEAERNSIRNQLDKAEKDKADLINKLSVLREEYTQLETELNNEKTKVISNSTEGIDEQTKAITTELKDDLDKKNKEINTLKSNLADKDNIISEKISDIGDLTEKINNLKTEVETLQAKIREQEGIIDNLTDNLNKVANSSTDLPQEQVERWNDELARMTNVIRQLNDIRTENERRIADLQGDISTAKEDYQKLKSEKDLLQNDYEKVQADYKISQEEVTEYKNEIEELKKQLIYEKESLEQDNQSEILEKNKEISKLKVEISNLTEQTAQDKREYSELSEKYEQLQTNFETAKNNDATNYKAVQDANEKIESLVKQVEDEIARRKGIEIQLETAQTNYNDLVSKVEESGGITKEMSDKLVALNEEIKTANNTISTYKERLDTAVQYEAKYNDLMNKWSQLEQSGKELEQKANELSNELANKTKDLTQSKLDYEATIRSKDDEIESLNQTVIQMKNNIELIKAKQVSDNDKEKVYLDKLTSAKNSFDTIKQKLVEADRTAIKEKNRADSLQEKLDTIMASSQYKMTQPLSINAGENVRVYTPANVESVVLMYDKIIESIKDMKKGTIHILDISSESYLNRAIVFKQSAFDFVDGEIKGSPVKIKVYSMAKCGVFNNDILTLETGLAEIISGVSNENLIIITDSLTSDFTSKLYNAMPNVKKSIICKVAPISIVHLNANISRYTLDNNTMVYAVSVSPSEPPALTNMLKECSHKFALKRLQGSLLQPTC